MINNRWQRWAFDGVLALMFVLCVGLTWRSCRERPTDTPLPVADASSTDPAATPAPTPEPIDDNPKRTLILTAMAFFENIANKRYDEAAAHCREAMSGFRRVLGDDPPSTLESISNMGALFEAQGRYTGYFEPFYEASPYRTSVYSAPVYTRPADLITVDLGRFRPELAGQRIAGRVVDGVLDPYPDHAAINGGALAGRARVIAYMRPSDLLFLQIQGSGRIKLSDTELRLGYDGANGRPYTAIGRTLIDMGALSKEAVSMQTIRDWLDRAPAAEARTVRESNESFVFFRVLDTLADPSLGPLGAQGVQLTPGRSLAVDPRYTPYGAPVFISIDGDPALRRTSIRRLMIAQDTGGAIKGAVRGDIFSGSGPRAGEVAGRLNETGEMFVLVPAPLAERLAKKPRWR